jgi:hypothetical protein
VVAAALRPLMGVADLSELQGAAGARAKQMPQVTSPFMVPEGDENSDSGRVPVFGTWKVIYVSVIAANLLVMTLVYFFSRFPF